jgi:hypothetical protein
LVKVSLDKGLIIFDDGAEHRKSILNKYKSPAAQSMDDLTDRVSSTYTHSLMPTTKNIVPRYRHKKAS